KITPSIFPPSEIAKHTDVLADKLDHYMVHLPLESGSAQMNKMQGTLMITDAPEKVLQRVEEIKRLFPNAKYINNHTGSVYTSNYQAMKVLYALLKQEGITFVDSRTDTRTQVPRVTKDLHERYISRDVFLDNVRNVSSIKAQLKEVVKVAKKQGYAIAIGHPYNVTMHALKNSQDILKDVDVVYIDELFGG
ncbi:MAG: divergent polysaccharide deacetylase family protein, partial [Campylobacterales bacterium]|nr:divergent polysaccharide deacetylase family protein [Campylobacterales bacterium]